MIISIKSQWELFIMLLLTLMRSIGEVWGCLIPSYFPQNVVDLRKPYFGNYIFNSSTVETLQVLPYSNNPYNLVTTEHLHQNSHNPRITLGHPPSGMVLTEIYLTKRTSNFRSILWKFMGRGETDSVGPTKNGVEPWSSSSYRSDWWN